MKKKMKGKDPLFLLSVFLIIIIGIVMIASSSYPEGLAKFNNGLYFLKRHLVFLVLGLIISWICSRISLQFIRKLSGLFFFISLILCLLLYTKLGIDHWGSVRWLKIPILNMEFMPSDLIKFASIFYFTDFILRHRNTIHQMETFIKILLIIGLSVGPIIFKDFSTGIVIGVSLLAIFYLMGIRLYQGGIIVFLGGFATYLLLTLERFAYRKKRLLAFLDPFDDIPDTDWQLAHSLYALGIGGFKGEGPFQSRLKQGYLPLSYNDFIFPIIGEEWGFIGTTTVLVLYFILCFRGYYFAIQAEDLYAKLVAVGITTSIGIQVFFNTGVAMGILPVTGLPLPLISYGGTSLIVTFAALGVLYGINRDPKGGRS
ncbi:MAG: putative peptidoglycan glycosyltransferase FtsW [Tissierellia bacterium]|nr:putative peptidoglycan glycosyltransferase FtsW [Tissierellia bacterium]